MPTYDYICTKCNHVWTEFRKMDERKIPESEPCPSCEDVGSVQQTVAFTSLPMSTSLEASNSMKKLNGSRFAEKLNQIHRNSPGSVLDRTSTIVDVK